MLRFVGAGRDAVMADRKMRVTAMDVALRAGVSQPTVSRALRGDLLVTEATREKVRQAARDLNYVVDKKASGLRLEKSNTLALVVVCRPGEDRSSINPFYFSLLGSIASTASLKNYNLLVSFQDGPENFDGDFVESRLADGMIVIGTTNNAYIWDELDDLRARGRRPVCWGSPDDGFDWVRSDNHAGGRLATEHLVEQGCRNIAFIGPLHSPQPQFDERFAGYREVLKRHDLPEMVVEPAINADRQQQGHDAVRNILDAGRKFDGIFASCDMIALGALRALREAGVSIPEEVAIAGFDAIRAGGFSEPGLTTIEPDFDEAAKMLVEMALAENLGDSKIHRRVPVRLLVRGSSLRRG